MRVGVDGSVEKGAIAEGSVRTTPRSRWSARPTPEITQEREWDTEDTRRAGAHR